jgi:hypothetical protein
MSDHDNTETAKRSYKFNVAMGIRTYGTVTIEASSLEAATEALNAAYVAEHFTTHGGGSDDYDMSHPKEIWVESCEDDETGEEFSIELDLPEGPWVSTQEQGA